MKSISIGFNTMDVYEFIKTMYPGGNELNTSIYAKENGADSAYLGYFGSDDRSIYLAKVANKYGVDLSHCRYREGVSGIAITTIVDGNRVFLRTNGGGVSAKYPINLQQEDLEYISGFDVVLTGYYANLGDEVLSQIRSCKVPIAYDFSEEFTEEELIQIAPLVNYVFLSCSNRDLDDIQVLLKKVISYGADLAVAMRGEQGQIAYEGENFYKNESEPVDVVDTIGAGDSFVTAFTLNYITNCNLKNKDRIQFALKKGAVFAAKICKVRGSFGNGFIYDELRE